jgi:hypothetical protein
MIPEHEGSVEAQYDNHNSFNVEGEQVVSETRLQKLEGRTYHIDGKVAAIETQLGTQSQQLSRIEQHLLRPKEPVNYGVWVGIALTILFGFGSMIVAGTSYVDIQLGHMRSVMVTMRQTMDQHAAHRVEDQKEAAKDAYSQGIIRGELDALGHLVQHMDERRHALDERVTELEAAASAGEVSRKAIGDYTRELGERLNDNEVFPTK